MRIELHLVAEIDGPALSAEQQKRLDAVLARAIRRAIEVAVHGDEVPAGGHARIKRGSLGVMT